MVLIRKCIATKATQSEHVMFMYIYVHGHTYCTSIRDHFTVTVYINPSQQCGRLRRKCIDISYYTLRGILNVTFANFIRPNFCGEISDLTCDFLLCLTPCGAYDISTMSDLTYLYD